MGIITEISSQKNRKRVNIFVDGEFVSGLSFETAVKHGLKKDLVIDEKRLQSIIEESEIASAFANGLDIVSISNKTTKELKQKLILKGFSEKVVESAILKLKEYKYVDDLAYAKSFIKTYKGKSKREIENRLRLKGISNDDLTEVLGLLTEESEFDGGMDYARKYMHRKVFDEKTKNNLFAGLARKGYSLDIIYSVINEINKEKQE